MGNRFPRKTASGNIFKHQNLHTFALEIIPVIDIKGGYAVHARRGQRESYRPLRTRLCPDGDPITLAAALRSFYPFRTIYLADLDALTGNGSNRVLIEKLVRRFPNTAFWLDQGWKNFSFLHSAESPWITVLGSESLNESILADLSVPVDQHILSLDFSASGLIGPSSLIENDRFWPDRVIIMNLASVGGNDGPNWARLNYFRNRWPMRRFIAAGGVRDENDLKRLAAAGFVGVLMATALHQDTVRASFIDQLQSETGPIGKHCPG